MGLDEKGAETPSLSQTLSFYCSFRFFYRLFPQYSIFQGKINYFIYKTFLIANNWRVNYEKREVSQMVDFSQKLKQLRKDKHLTQAQVAAQIGVTPAMVSAYETDIRLPSYEVMVQLADLFGVTVDYLLCRQSRRFLDISDLSDEEAAIVCGMVELLKKKRE